MGELEIHSVASVQKQMTRNEGIHPSLCSPLAVVISGRAHHSMNPYANICCDFITTHKIIQI